VLWSTLRLYPQLFKIVFMASGRAKKGAYTSTDWSDDSMRTLVALERSGCHIEIDGMRHIAEAEGPVVFVGNHMSTTETFLLPGIIDPIKPVTFVIKPSLMDYPIFGPVMRSRNPIVVSRDNPRQDLVTVLEEGKARLRDGISIVLFPQTTRVLDFSPEKFNTLGIKLAKSVGVPVIPFALKTDAWGNGKMVKEFGRIDPKLTIHFSFGAPVTIEGNGKEAHEQIVRLIGEKFASWA
jgi:1-acyl-sn-glycerol-3-phosphate acyltransferase